MAETKKKQTMRFNEHELDTIKAHFAENEVLGNSLRRFFLQLDMTQADTDLIEKYVGKNDNLKAVIRKTFLPTIDPAAPQHQIIDLWMTLDLKEKAPDAAYPFVLSRELLIKYLEQQLTILEGGKIAKSKLIKLSDMCEIAGKDPVTVWVELATRNTAISHVEQQLAQFNLLAGLKSETIEQTRERLLKQSGQ